REPGRTASTTPDFLSDLGRATLRGIRKCPQCGIYNGTRGLSCKNKACGIKLRNAAPGCLSRKNCPVEVVRVIIDSERTSFSVCHRGRGAAATHLGFVELVPTDTAIATGDGATLLTRINLGRCFVPSCRAAGSKPSSDSLCVHIKQAIECHSRASPLPFKSSVLEGLQVSMQARAELWRLATESPGPLVQRVTKDTLVVKCHADSQHPLGLLHLSVGAGGLSEGPRSERRSKEQQQAVFLCACQLVGRRGKAGSSCHPPGSAQPPRCLHFYACVCAFASDEKLSAEFAAFINYSLNGTVAIIPVLLGSVNSKVWNIFLNCLSGGQQSDSSGGVIPREKPLQQAEPSHSRPKIKKLRLDEALSGAPSHPRSTQVVDEQAVTLGFHQWLASVTERIHLTMHYQNHAGKPQPLVYHIPQDFFNVLQQRLSLGSKKKRLPNFTTGPVFVRNDGLPMGSCTKYTWHITDLSQVKRIFDTPEVPLELSQSFVKNIDGTYSPFRCPEPPPQPEGHRTERPLPIRPLELRTFLRVGTSSADPKEAGPFVIEWIPDVLPRSHVGELRISFEYGHQQSGQL
uniref:Chromosome 2 open reading frame 42 n=1 Tax=Tetraodon nigroviridis TaxID=99883 RepID=H3D7H3_TETNG